MVTKAENGRQLLKQSLTFLKGHKRLFIFPLIGYLCRYSIFILLLKPFINHEELQALNTPIPTHTIFLIIGIYAITLFFINLILFFFNAAIIESILAFIRNDKEARFFYGFKAALKNAWRIYLWAIFSGTYGIFINLIPKNYFKHTQSLLKNNIWSIASFFAFIQVIDKKLGPVKTLKESARLVSQTWGEHLRPRFAYSKTIVLAKLIALTPLLVGIFIGTHKLIIITAIISVLLFLLISMCAHLIYTTWKVACYSYINDKKVIPPFDAALFDKLFRNG